MQKIIVLSCVLFLLSACSGSRYYFHKRIRPAGTDVPIAQVAEKNNVPAENHLFEASVVTETDRQPVEATFIPKEKEEKEAIVQEKEAPSTVEKRNNLLVVPLGNQGSLLKKTIQVRPPTKKLHPLVIFAIVIGSIAVATFVIALLLGTTAGQALEATAIVLLLVLVLILYTALKSW